MSDSVCLSVCVKTLVPDYMYICVHACASILCLSARTCVCLCVCACVCVYSDSVGGDPWSGSPVTGAHLRFCELSSQCAKEPPEDRISHCDLAPEVTEIHLRGQT